MSSVELGPNNSNILIQQDPLLSNSVTIVLDDVFSTITMAVSAPQEVIKGIASIRIAPSSLITAGVPNVTDVITTNNLEVQGEVELPSLVLSKNLYSLPKDNRQIVSSQASQSTVVNNINKKTIKLLVNNLTNSYSR